MSLPRARRTCLMLSLLVACMSSPGLGTAPARAESTAGDSAAAAQQLVELLSTARLDAMAARGDSLITASRELTTRVQALQAMGVRTQWLGVMDQQAQQLAKEGLRVSDSAKSIKNKIAVAGYSITAFQVASNVYDDVALYGNSPREVWSTSLLGAADGMNAVFQKGWPLSSLGLAAWAFDQAPASTGLMSGVQIFLRGVSDPVGAVIDVTRALREVFKTLGDTDAAVQQAIEGIYRLAQNTIKRQGWTGRVGAQRVVTAPDTATFLAQAKLSLAAQRQTAQSQAREISSYLAELNDQHDTLVPAWAPNKATLQANFESHTNTLRMLREQLLQFDAKLADPKQLIPLISPMADAWLMVRLQQADQAAIENRRLQDHILQLSRRATQQPPLNGSSSAPLNMVISQGDTLELSGTVAGTEPMNITVTQIDSSTAKEVVWPVPRSQGQNAWKWRSVQPILGNWTFQVHVSDASKARRLLSQSQVAVIPAQHMPRPSHELDAPPAAAPRPSLFSTLDAASRLSLLQRAGFHGSDLAALNQPEPAAPMLLEAHRASRADSYAALARLVYTPIEKQGPWTRVNSRINSLTGFQAATYRHDNGQIVVAFAGTDSALDLAVDVHGVFLPTLQQAEAVQYALYELQKYGKGMMVTGHSLGGALAQISALMFGLNAVTFNSAALNNPARLLGKYRSSSTARVFNFYVSGEGVGAASRLGVFGANVGEDIEMGVTPNTGALKHSIESVQFAIYALKNLQDNYFGKPAAGPTAPSGALSAPPLTLLRPGQTLTLSGTFRNASGAKVVFTKPIPTESPVSSFDPVRGTWSFNKLMLSEGQYSYDVVLLGKPDTIIYKGNVDVRAMDSAGGTLTQPTPASVAVNTPWSIAGQFSGKIIDIFVDFTDPASGAIKRDRVSSLDSGAGRWGLSRSFPVPGSYGFKVIGLHPVTKAEIAFGSGTVAVTAAASPPSPAPTPPGSPRVTAAQPTTALKVGQPASFNVMGDNLNPQVPLTFGACINPSIGFRDNRNMVLSCTPSAPGPQNFGWKPAPGVVNVTVLRQFEVLPKDAPSPADGMRLERETFLDNTLVDGGSRVDKSWTLQNTGSSTWSTAYCLRPQAGHLLGSAPVCVTGPVAPGQFHTFHAPLQMPPAQASNATVRQTWRLSNASGSQVGPEIWVQLVVKGNAPAPVLSVVEPFTMPTAVRVGSEPWVGSLNLNLPASQVQMVLINPQGQSQGSVNWSPGANAQQWQLRHSFTSAGIYNWTLNAQGPSGSVRRSGSVQVLAAVPTNPPGGAPSAQFNANSRVAVGQTWELLVTTSAPAAAVRLQFSNSTAPLTNLTKLSDTQFRHTQTFNSPGVLSFNVRTSFQGSPLQSSPGMVQIDAAATNPVPNPTPPTPVPPVPPVKITPVLNVPAVVASGAPWSASLRVDEPVASASLVFRTGRRIQFDGGPQQWSSPTGQSTFHEAGRFDYQLEIRRSSTSNAVEMYPGGVLEVRAAPVPTIALTVTSAPTVEQGQSYLLTVQTSASADRVTVTWPGVNETNIGPARNPEKTSWVDSTRRFAEAQPQAFIVRSYKDGLTAPTGELRGQIVVSAAAAGLRLVRVETNVLKGAKLRFEVMASASIARVQVQLGSSPAVDMTGGGAGQGEQTFIAQVLAAQSGAVPYVITGLNAQGQPVGNRLTGTATVAEPGDSLKAPNPIPAEIQQGQAVRWQFLTHRATAEMWLEFSGAIGKLPLNGAFLDQSFNYPGGDYSYRLMRRDDLGNVFPIQGAAGVLRIKPGVALPVQFTAAALNGQPIVAGAALRFKTGELIQAAVRTSSAVPNLFILIPSVPWDRDLNSSDKLQWSVGMAGLPKGSHPAILHVKLPNGQPSGNPVAVSFNIVIEDNPPPRISIQSASAIPASVKVGQSMNFVAQLSAPAAVQRAELLFPDVNVTEPMTQGGPSSWARARPMTQAGANRPYRMVLTLADGQRLQQDGVYTVLPADLPQLSLQPPAPVKVGQTMSFSAQLSAPAAVQRAELLFPDANVTEPMTQAGPSSWTRARSMTLAGANRPYRVVLTLVDGQRLQQDGVYTVLAADLPQLSLQPPTPGKLGQPMSFNAQLSTPAAVQGAALLFPDVNVTEPMTQAGPNSWTRVRPMTQAGNNRPYRVVVTLADGQRLQQDGVYTVASELPLPLPLQPPAPVKAGQSMSFNAQLSMPAAVQRAELLFPDVNVTEPMTQTGSSSWTRTRTMTQAGNNRPYRVVLTLASGQRFQQEGVYTVFPADLPLLSLQPPAPVKVGQTMSFNAQLSAQATVQRAELLFPDVNVTEPMTQTGPTSWTRARPMTQAGSNRPYRVALTLADGQRLQQDGVYTVLPADLPQLSLQAPAPVKAGQNMSFNAQLSMPAAVQRAELVFPDANVTEPMTQTGPSSWTRVRPMSQAGDNRPYRVALTLADGQRLQQDGVYTVMPADLPLQFNIQASPPSVRQGQTMSFNLRLNNPAMLGRAELIFPDANVTEVLTQTGPDSWGRSRSMVQPGNNRPFIIRLLLRDGSSQQASGNYSVTP